MGLRTKVIANVDFDTNEEIKTNLNRKRVESKNVIDKEALFGDMIEERHVLQKALDKKKMSFAELLTFLNNKR